MYWSGNNNQIYKALIQLQNEGYVTSEIEHQQSLPSKKIYAITEGGLAELKEWVLSSPEAPEFKKPFLIQLAWSDLLSDQELSELLEKYESEVRLQLVLHQEKAKRGGHRPARSAREEFLWQKIDESMISSCHNELEWIREIRKELFENEWNEEKKSMNYKLVETENTKYIELVSSENPIRTGQDALDVIALCGEHDSNLLMLHSQALSDEFFSLKTGVAGEVLQKFVNYSIKAAIVIPGLHDNQGSGASSSAAEKAKVGKFRELVLEANRGSQYRVFSEKEEAEKWLLSNIS